MSASTVLYMDHAATSPLRPQAREAMLTALELGANASSVHSLGRRAKMIVEEARAQVLDLVGGYGAKLIFTSGGTEANNMALHQARVREDITHLIISDGEHDSIYTAANYVGKPVLKWPLLPSGLADLEALRTLLAQVEGRAFVALMLVNNETGIIQPVADAAEIVRAAGGWLHVDAVQAAGKINIDFDVLGADSLTLTGHKIGGPVGVGALVYNGDHTIIPMITGGGQEQGLRAGTENVAGLAAFGAAALAVQLCERLPQQTAVEAALKELDARIIGGDVARVPGITCLAVPDWSSQLQLIHMDMAGICVSSGSACSSGKVKHSRVLNAMGLENLSGGVLRISTGWSSQPADWDRFFEVWSGGYKAFRARQSTKLNIKEQA
ncbi:cysteine desulfurase family protein [Asticcacaulis sp. SL142]|uniref:cysteine desulfurase family protein n=1 Tax=Asticcacaulis sp. SL142 TaxID=2995155 RepID=UPI00226CEE2B|nr:cysteine desulfurase family protein [Asticcacaulis sp. SL142]WAC48721.1 cysteine desulfurase family protein [Asticcacaulis sp. SL142]